MSGIGRAYSKLVTCGQTFLNFVLCQKLYHFFVFGGQVGFYPYILVGRVLYEPCVLCYDVVRVHNGLIIEIAGFGNI